MKTQELALHLGKLVETPQRHYPHRRGKSEKRVGTLMEIDLVINQGGVWFEGDPKTDLTNFPVEDLKPIDYTPMYTIGQMKDCALKFFYYWWNAKGSNTEQGLRDWMPGYIESMSK